MCLHKTQGNRSSLNTLQGNVTAGGCFKAIRDGVLHSWHMESVWLASHRTNTDWLSKHGCATDLCSRAAAWFLGRKKYYFSDFTPPRFRYESPLPNFTYASMPKDFYVRLEMGGKISVPSTLENDDFCAVLSCGTGHGESEEEQEPRALNIMKLKMRDIEEKNLEFGKKNGWGEEREREREGGRRERLRKREKGDSEQTRRLASCRRRWNGKFISR